MTPTSATPADQTAAPAKGPSLLDQVTTQSTDIKAGRAALWVVAAVFYVVGVLLGLVISVLVVAVRSVKVGIVGARQGVETTLAPTPAPELDVEGPA